MFYYPLEKIDPQIHPAYVYNQYFWKPSLRSVPRRDNWGGGGIFIYSCSRTDKAKPLSKEIRRTEVAVSDRPQASK